MNNKGATSSKQISFCGDEEIFDDSIFLENFDNSSFWQTKNGNGNNMNDSHNSSALNVSALCCDEEISGYDRLSGKTWIYPTNYPVRDYQFNIIKAGLVKNTLVSLPTGLGKTFIAAVIMYNFYRWYPLCKIVFTAPTRPLVAQQIDACYNIIGIPPEDTIEMTGHMQVNTRKGHWQNKRVFFATPQVIYNDIKSGICPANKIRCLVMDEAHKARGNYAYCQIVSCLDDMGHRTYRMLALSATPGSKVEDVISVVKSLHIAHLELREENCIDVAPYSHARKINTVVVQLGPELSQLRQQYIEILDGYARRLKQFNILPQNLGNLSKGRIVMLYKEYQTKDRGARHPQHNYIMKDFTILIALYHGLELLVKHGQRVFLNFFDEHPEKSWIQADDRLTSLLERLRDDLGVNPLSLDRSILPDGSIPEIPKNLTFGHPKFDTLKSIMMEHFTIAKQNNRDTRAIVFCEYRESVNLVHCLLLQCRPVIKPQMFVGQGASGKDGKAVVSQKQQLRVMRSFREGACNTLIATCVAEEGLDVGSVDLILCFDISTRSPIRLVQRCGRTGRERGGQVHILVTEGKEHQTLLDCIRQRDGLNRKILQSKEVENNLYKLNPRMMPRDFTPECRKIYISVTKKPDDKGDNKKESSKKGQKDLRTMLSKQSSSSSNSSKASGNGLKDVLITEEEFNALYPDKMFTETRYLRKRMACFAMSKEQFLEQVNKPDDGINLATWLEWQRTPQNTVNIGHSKRTEVLTRILQKCDERRLQPTQQSQLSPILPSQSSQKPQQVTPSKLIQLRSPTKAKPKRKPKAPIFKSPAKKDGDIRALFSTATKSTKSYTKLINDLGIQNGGTMPTKLVNLLVDLNLDNTNITKSCYFCDNICDCNKITSIDNKKGPVLMKLLTEPVLPDLELVNDIQPDAFLNLNKSQDLLNTSKDNRILSPHFDNEDDNEVIVLSNKNTSANFDLEFDFDALEDVNSPETNEKEAEDIETVNEKNFDIGDIDDIFADSSPEEVIQKEIVDVKNIPQALEKVETKDALGFFGLDSIEDIFADSDDAFEENRKEVTPKKKTGTEKDKYVLKTPEKTNIVTNSPSEALFRNTPSDDLEVTLILDDSPLEETGDQMNEKHTNINQIMNKNHTEVTKANIVGPVSPSILSGVSKRDVPTSPILCSQTRKFSLSTKRNKPNSSTPNSSAKKKLILPKNENNNVIEIPDDNFIDNKNNEKSHNMNKTTNKSMFTITQLVDMINDKSVTKNDASISKNIDVSTSSRNKKERDISMNAKDSNRSTSPIIFTQADKKKVNLSTSKVTQKSESLIILDSDSDSTIEYDLDEISVIEDNTTKTSPQTNKRKIDDRETESSPYFNKKPKLDIVEKPLTLQQKVLAAIVSNKIKDNFQNNQTNMHFTVSQPNLTLNQQNTKNYLNKSDENIKLSPIDSLQKYRKDSKVLSLRNKFSTIFKKSDKKSSPNKENIFEDDDDFMSKGNESSIFDSKCFKDPSPVKRRIKFVESDDDFVSDKSKSPSPKKAVNHHRSKPLNNHKVRKKKRQSISLIDMEAALSDEEDSGDELSDDSVGSIAEFICDEDVSRQDDMQMYLKSVRSPIKKNGFKIPELPKRFNKEDVFSQFVREEEDSYEMDSFCVDSHIGLTQVNEISELELAELVLKEERRAKRKGKQRSQSPQNDDSPVVKRSVMKTRRIDSDSDDSS